MSDRYDDSDLTIRMNGPLVQQPRLCVLPGAWGDVVANEIRLRRVANTRGGPKGQVRV